MVRIFGSTIASVKAILTKVRDIIKGNKQATTANLISLLNPVIRGWANYHRHVVSKETFGKVDHALWKTIFQWARRRHPNKSLGWTRRRYFKSVAGDNWVLFAASKDGKEMYLRKCTKTTIKRHVKVIGEANPYDPDWEVYFEEREARKWRTENGENQKLAVLWREQNGK